MPWWLEQKRDRSGALMILAASGFLLGGWLAMIQWDRDAIAIARDDARSVAEEIRGLALHDGSSCGDALAKLPAVRGAATLRRDPWGHAWSIRCVGDLAVVRSAGADGEFGADDDIVEVALTPPQIDR